MSAKTTTTKTLVTGTGSHVEIETMVVECKDLQTQDLIITKNGTGLLLTAEFNAPFGADFRLFTIQGMDQARRFPMDKKFRIAAR